MLHTARGELAKSLFALSSTPEVMWSIMASALFGGQVCQGLLCGKCKLLAGWSLPALYTAYR